jgi:hypothetical protein
VKIPDRNDNISIKILRTICHFNLVKISIVGVAVGCFEEGFNEGD